jgi:D-alanine--D-alanine ligase
MKYQQHRDHRLRIGVLMGGMSIEREVSFNSGRTICDHLDAARFQVVPLFQAAEGVLYILPLRFLHRGKISDFEQRLADEAQQLSWDDLSQYIDFAYIAMHGRYAEDGTMQGMLEILGIPYFGSKVFASALGMDKLMQKKFLTAAGIIVPDYIVYSIHDIRHMRTASYEYMQQLWESVQTQLGARVVVKPLGEGSSCGVSCVDNAEAFYRAVIHAAEITPGIIQPVICEAHIQGMEFSCIVITDPHTGAFLPLPPTEIAHDAEDGIFDYVQKYMPGRAMKYTPARCFPEQIRKIQTTCVAVAQTLRMCTFGRIDGFLREDGSIVIIDPNTLGGMAPASFTFVQAAQIGMNHTQLMNHLLDAELRAYHMDQPSLRGESMQSDEPRIRVAVLMGGATAEREVSLESGRNITYKLSPHRYEVTPLFVNEQHLLYRLSASVLVKNRTSEIADAVCSEDRLLWSELSHVADFVFIGLHGGKGEDGSVQGALELLQLPYNGSSVLASSLCMDKYATSQFLRSHGFDVPRGVLVSSELWKQGAAMSSLLAEQQLSFPLIVKPHDDGCSTHVYKVHHQPDLEQALSRICAERAQMLIEELVIGMELTVGVLGNEDPLVLPPSHSVATQGILSVEEKFLPGAGENQTPAPLPPDAIIFVQQKIRDVYQAIGCRGYARIDCFYQSAQESATGKERLVILEINSLPALTPATCFFHQAAEVGMSPMDVIDRIVQYGLEAHRATRVSATRERVASIISERAV